MAAMTGWRMQMEVGGSVVDALRQRSEIICARFCSSSPLSYVFVVVVDDISIFLFVFVELGLELR